MNVVCARHNSHACGTHPVRAARDEVEIGNQVRSQVIPPSLPPRRAPRRFLLLEGSRKQNKKLEK